MKQVKVSTDVFGSSVGHTFYECGEWKIAIRAATPLRPVDIIVDSPDGEIGNESDEAVASIILAIMANPPR